MNGTTPRWVAAAASVGVVAAAVHGAPAVTAATPIRRRLWPTLSGLGARDRVAVTFDDGPDPDSTPAFIRVLDATDVQATFFLLGQMLEKDPSLGRRLVENGHDLGLHGWSHRCLLGRGPRATYEDMARGQDALTRQCGLRPRWYRPPYGVLTTSAVRAARRLDLTPVLWTTWGRDWSANATAESVSSHVRRRLAPGGTILLHDSDCTSAPQSWRSALAALPGLIDEIRDRGLVPGPLRDHWSVEAAKLSVSTTNRSGDGTR